MEAFALDLELGTPVTNSAVEGTLSCAGSVARRLRHSYPDGLDHQMHRPNGHWLDLCITPRPGDLRASYVGDRRSSRFEKVGTLFIVPRGEALRVRAGTGGRQSSIVLQFAETLIPAWSGTDTDTFPEGAGGLDIRDRSIAGLMMRIAREIASPGLASETVLEMCSGLIGVELARHFAMAGPSSAKGGLSARRLRLIEERLRDHGAAPSLGELAGLCGLSVRQLCRGFQASRGVSVGRYVESVRIEQAKGLLMKRGSIKSVAAAMGFASTSNFSNAFTRTVGMSPSAFRQDA